MTPPGGGGPTVGPLSFGTTLLEVRGVSKSFPGVQALEDMHLDLRAGEVLGLVLALSGASEPTTEDT